MESYTNKLSFIRIRSSNKNMYFDGLCWIFSIILIIGTFFPSSEACSCAIMHPQGYFCSADFVVKAMVKSKKFIYSKPAADGEDAYPLYQRYTLRIIRSYKENEVLKNNTVQHLYTSVGDNMCGQNFHLKEKYLISGRANGGKLFTSSCDYNGVWKSLTKWQRRGLTRHYGENCECKIEACYSTHCRQKNLVEDRGDMCLMDFNRDPDFCHTKFSRCSRRDSGDCRWNKTGDFKRCMAETKRKAWAEP